MDCGMSHREAITLTPLPSTVFESLLFPDLPFGFLIVWNVVLTDWSVVLFPSSKNLFSEYLVALMQMSTLSEAFSPPFPNSRQVGMSSISSSDQLDTSIGLSPKQLPCAVFNAKSSVSFCFPHIQECLYPPFVDILICFLGLKLLLSENCWYIG